MHLCVCPCVCSCYVGGRGHIRSCAIDTGNKNGAGVASTGCYQVSEFPSLPLGGLVNTLSPPPSMCA